MLSSPDNNETRRPADDTAGASAGAGVSAGSAGSAGDGTPAQDAGASMSAGSPVSCVSYERMGTGRILPLVFIFGLPGVISQLVQVSYSVIDSAFIGNAVGSNGLAALSLSLAPVLFFIAIAILVSAGSVTLFSMKLGQGDVPAARRILGSTLVLAIVISVLSAILTFAASEPVLRLLGATPATLELAQTYLHIYGAGFIAQNMGYTINGFINACGRPRRAVFTQVVAAVLNVILDYIFVMVLGWGVAGAAWATVFAWTVGALVALEFFVNPHSTVQLKLKDVRLNREYAGRSLAYGLPVFLMMLGNVAFTSIFMSVISTWGGASSLGAEGALAVANVVSRGFQVLLIPAIGLSNGCMTLFGYNLGAGLYSRLRSLFWTLVLVGFAAITALWLPMMLWAPSALVLFGLNGAAIELGAMLLRIDILCMPLVVVEVVSGSFLQGTGRYVRGSILLLMSSVLVIGPLTIIFPHVLPQLFDVTAMQAIYIASPVTLTCMLLVASIIMAAEFRRLRKLNPAA